MKKIIDFILHGVWRVKVSELSFFNALGVRSLRFIILIVRSFTKDELQQKAAVLSYYTLLSLVPIVALLVAFTRSFFLEDAFVDMLVKKFRAQEELIRKVVAMGQEAIEATSHTAIAGIGVAIFIWSTLKIINYLEEGLNSVFHSTESRSFLRKVSDYFAVLVLSPLFLVLSTGITIYLSTKITGFAKEHHTIGVVLYFIFNILSSLLISFLFTFLYLFLTNTKVQFFAALIGGIIAGLIYQVFQITYFNAQIVITKANPVLGTVSILPLLLIWVQLSWLILLLGAKITNLIQNIDAYEFMVEDFSLKPRLENLLALLITQYCVKQFASGSSPPTTRQISDHLSLPLYLIKNVCDKLEASHILLQVKYGHQEEMGYHPACDIEHLTIKKVLDMINENGDDIPLPSKLEIKTLQKSLDNFNHLMEHSKSNLLLKNI